MIIHCCQPMAPPSPPLSEPEPKTENDSHSLVFDASVLQHQPTIPQQFIWPVEERPLLVETPELEVPLVDLGSFLSGDPVAVSQASCRVNEACKKHGFFLVVNHGIDQSLIDKAHEYMDSFFSMQLSDKQRAQRKVGEHCGYASSFTGRFSSKLPWKETLSFRYSDEDSSSKTVEEYFSTVLGNDFYHFG